MTGEKHLNMRKLYTINIKNSQYIKPKKEKRKLNVKRENFQVKSNTREWEERETYFNNGELNHNPHSRKRLED